VSFAAIILSVASQRMFIDDDVYFLMTQFENFWLHHCVITRENNWEYYRLYIVLVFKALENRRDNNNFGTE
jgi:hypothetical protein